MKRDEGQYYLIQTLENLSILPSRKFLEETPIDNSKIRGPCYIHVYNTLFGDDISNESRIFCLITYNYFCLFRGRWFIRTVPVARYAVSEILEGYIDSIIILDIKVYIYRLIYFHAQTVL